MAPPLTYSEFIYLRRYAAKYPPAQKKNQRLGETPLILGAQNASVEVVAALLEEKDTDIAALNVRFHFLSKLYCDYFYYYYHSVWKKTSLPLFLFILPPPSFFLLMNLLLFLVSLFLC